ncbi:fragile X mental retardation 1 neighbor protein [Rattus rattus]|uniref:fragile X mental retardation 1 neighbor protein n=1 Tax=Rattus rattus TaxID=10117 RepID=UPI0013F3376F|nr:fragile X mental retardation 1 neighbor protein [Rattus rattus]
MPSDLKPRPGRNRSKSHSYRGAHYKIISADTGNRGQTLSSGHGNNMVGASLFGFWTAISQYLQNLWARRHIGLLLLLLWTLVILCYLVNTDSLPPSAKLSLLDDSVELGPQWDSMLDFFFPTRTNIAKACIVRDNKELVACNNQPYLSKTECLSSKCCFSSSGTEIKCHAPLRDKPTQMLRLFGCVMISMVILGFLPVYCCSLCRRRKKMNRIVKVLKKQKARLKKEPKGRMVSEERALLSG